MKEWFILELHETKRMSHVVTWPIAFILFSVWGGQVVVFKVMENVFSIFSSLGTFPMFLGQWGSDLYKNCMKWQ